MSRYRSYLDVAKKIISDYRGEIPFAAYLKNFFSGRKKFGSTDRKTIAAICYNYFRAENALSGSIDEKIVHSFFLVSDHPHPFLEEMNIHLNRQTSLSPAEKLKLLSTCERKLFPFVDHMSDQIDVDLFSLSFLLQPALFLRLRPGKEKLVLKKLDEAGVKYERPDGRSVRIDNGTKLADIIAINREAVVQDLSSQHTLDFIEGLKFESLPQVWDCCAASGGKSILAFDLLKENLRLTVTDIRSGILKNLTQRLREAGVPVYHASVKDLSGPVIMQGKFEMIICDAPCSGSGTWARTPEQLHFFEKESITRYTALQRQIINNSIPHLKPGGIFIYITCSVFAEENEAQVDHILQQPGMSLLHSRYIKGYGQGADTLFTSIFRLSS